MKEKVQYLIIFLVMFSSSLAALAKKNEDSSIQKKEGLFLCDHKLKTCVLKIFPDSYSEEMLALVNDKMEPVYIKNFDQSQRIIYGKLINTKKNQVDEKKLIVYGITEAPLGPKPYFVKRYEEKGTK